MFLVIFVQISGYLATFILRVVFATQYLSILSLRVLLLFLAIDLWAEKWFYWLSYGWLASSSINDVVV